MKLARWRKDHNCRTIWLAKGDTSRRFVDSSTTDGVRQHAAPVQGEVELLHLLGLQPLHQHAGGEVSRRQQPLARRRPQVDQPGLAVVSAAPGRHVTDVLRCSETRMGTKSAGVYILFEISYTFHNFFLNLPPSKKNFALRANFCWNFYKSLTFLGKKKFLGQRLEGQRVERLEGQRVERLEGWM